MMRLRHVTLPFFHRLTRRFPALGRFSFSLSLLLLIWLYTLHWGERSTFTAHIKACDWETWEQWPAGAQPHRLVLIADPQLVDPHTYPGRPWPLSTLTEKYTDRYMARNFRLINRELDPDSIVFLGDLFDGGREWEPAKARPLAQWQIDLMRQWRQTTANATEKDVDTSEGAEQAGELEEGGAKSEQSLADHDGAHIGKKREDILKGEARDLKTFVPGENGRWQKWGQKQWEKEYFRFVRIFFDQKQLYPSTTRQIITDYLAVPPGFVNVVNGAHNATRFQSATIGGKQRGLITSLPGNHDLGFGEKVQSPVRNRFSSRFGEGNRVDVIGNHTLVSVDTPSLSARDQYLEGGETSTERAHELRHIWEPTADFLSNLTTTVAKTNMVALRAMYPDKHAVRELVHDVLSLKDADKLEPKQNTQSIAPKLPVILLTHVPLYRDHDTDCGHQRERGKAIPIAAGYQYQNVITKPLTSTLIGHVSAAGSIAHVFSGDDHDYCDLNHRYNVDVPGSRSTALRNIREVTVKSFSWAMGVRRPGFQLVSLWNPIDTKGETVGVPLPTIQSHLCLLPNQLSIFIDYALLLGFTLIVLIIRAVWVGLRASDVSGSDSDDDLPTISTLGLPQFELKSTGSANGFSATTRNASLTKGRQRASSTSTSKYGTQNSNKNLSVQRTFTARTRSVSPRPFTPASTQTPTGPLIDQAGYYPTVRWTDPDDLSEDEESNIGSAIDEDDSQAKWRRRTLRPKGKFRKVLDELGSALLFVGGLSAAYYVWLIRHG